MKYIIVGLLLLLVFVACCALTKERYTQRVSQRVPQGKLGVVDAPTSAPIQLKCADPSKPVLKQFLYGRDSNDPNHPDTGKRPFVLCCPSSNSTPFECGLPSF